MFNVHDDNIMSYLIALYVYYHGNNLEVFGITKGLRDEDINNGGLKRASEINPTLVDHSLIEEAKKREAMEEEMMRNDWDNIMRQAIKSSQQRDYQLFKTAKIENSVFNTTPDAIIDNYESEGSIPLDFFTEINS